MKLKTIVSVAALTMGCCGLAHAGVEYFPPERVECRLDTGLKLNCEGFNRQYLAEHVHTANFEHGQDKGFTFRSAVAYFTPDEKEWSILVTYKDIQNKEVILKSVNYTIKPDLRNGDWKRTKNEFYTCESSYMNCSLTK